jgi:hypothetical protein
MLIRVLVRFLFVLANLLLAADVQGSSCLVMARVCLGAVALILCFTCFTFCSVLFSKLLNGNSPVRTTYIWLTPTQSFKSAQ